jgi:HK97 family phage prohead protease
MQPEVERRSVREVRAKDDAKIEGYAAVFNSLSEELFGFREIIMPGAFDRALREGHDVRALVNHDPNQILGRTKSGTLKLSVDERGLMAEIDPPDTQAARDALTSIKRGDIDGMSFAFRTITDNWRMEDGEQIRELVDVELLDVSVVAYPAYSATQVSARAIEHARTKLEPPPAGVPNEVNAARLKMAAQ